MSGGKQERGRVTSEMGSALVELAVALPVLVLIVVGAADFARVFYLGIELTDAARAGAQYGAQGVGQSGDVAGMRTTAVNAAPEIPSFTTGNVTAVQNCYCPSQDGNSWPTVVCHSGCASGDEAVVVTVTATKTFSSISRMPPFQNILSISRSATLRAQ